MQGDGNNFLTSVYNIEFAIKDLDNDGLVEVIAAGQSSKLTNEATTVMAMGVENKRGKGWYIISGYEAIHARCTLSILTSNVSQSPSPRSTVGI